MLDDNNIGVHGIGGENSYCGIGYVSIPKNIDRDEYIQDCYKRNVVTMFGGQFHPLFYDVPLTTSAIQEIKFPDKVGEYGSALVWLNVPYYNKPLVIAVLKANSDIYLVEQENWRVTKTIDENTIDINAKASNASLTFNIQASRGVEGKYKIRIVNDEETCVYDLYVKGTIWHHSTKKYTIISDEAFEFIVVDEKGNTKGNIRYEKGKGFSYEDEFDNSITADKGGIVIINKKGDKITVNDGIQIETAQDIDIAAGENTISLDDSGVSVNSPQGVFINGSNQVLYSLIPGATEIVDVSQIGVSQTVKVG